MKTLINRKKLEVSGIAIATLLMLVAFSAQTQEVEPVLEASSQAADDTARSQDRIDDIDAETQRILSDYRAGLKQYEQLQRYNASQERQVQAQRRELASLEEDINNIASLQRAMQPLMDDMVNALERLVEADLPFLMDERRARVERLKGAIEDPEMSPAQRFRLVIEAYQIENEYGRTIEAYRGDIEADGRLYENVEFLRIGRVALIFHTDNDEVLKRYVPQQNAWVDLDRSYLKDVKMASRVAREQIPPELLYMPVRAPSDDSE